MATPSMQSLVNTFTDLGACTVGEFKGYVMPFVERLIKAEFLGAFRKRTEKKLSIFDGYSFDKMYKKFNSYLEDLEKHKKPLIDLTARKDKDKYKNIDKLIKILADYKGKRSPYKLKIAKKAIDELEKLKSNVQEEESVKFEDVTGIKSNILEPAVQKEEDKSEEKLLDLLKNLEKANNQITGGSRSQFCCKLGNKYFEQNFFNVCEKHQSLLSKQAMGLLEFCFKTLDNGPEYFEKFNTKTRGYEDLKKIETDEAAEVLYNFYLDIMARHSMNNHIELPNNLSKPLGGSIKSKLMDKLPQKFGENNEYLFNTKDREANIQRACASLGDYCK